MLELLILRFFCVFVLLERTLLISHLLKIVIKVVEWDIVKGVIFLIRDKNPDDSGEHPFHDRKENKKLFKLLVFLSVMISVYITCTNKKEAEKIAAVLLDKKLIACVNMFPVTSVFLWKGKKERSREYALLGKTIEGKFKGIEKEVRKLHSYKTPFIGMWEEQTTESVERWLWRELK